MLAQHMADSGDRGEKRGEPPSDDRPPSKQSRIDFEAITAEEHRRRVAEQADKGTELLMLISSFPSTDARQARIEHIKRKRREAREQIEKAGLVNKESGQKRDDVAPSDEDESEEAAAQDTEKKKKGQKVVLSKRRQREVDDEDGILVEEDTNQGTVSLCELMASQVR